MHLDRLMLLTQKSDFDVFKEKKKAVLYCGTPGCLQSCPFSSDVVNSLDHLTGA